MNTIKGRYDPDDWFCEVTFDGRVLDPKPSQRLRNHSPDGFAWGYAGSGPAQLALAILLAAGVPDAVALRHYQAFKFEFLAPLARDTFTLSIDVKRWVDGQELKRIAAERARG